MNKYFLRSVSLQFNKNKKFVFDINFKKRSEVSSEV